MDKRQLGSNIIRIGGILEFLIALLHFLWPIQLVETGEFTSLSIDYSNYLVLSCISVGLCQALFGVLCFSAAKALITGEKLAWLFCVTQSMLWLIRGVLEMIFPVRVPLFMINTPTILVLPLSFLLGLLFLIPVVTNREQYS